MKLNRDKTAFGRHETFPLRYGWLTKGYAAVKESPDIFRQPERAMVRLGVGRNMVNAIEYWLHAVGVVEFGDGAGRPTELGETLLGDAGDRYLEDEATLWILHWLLASNAEEATGLFWFFNRFSPLRFQYKDALRALGEFVEQDLRLNRSPSTLKSELSTLLRLYAPEAGRTDEHLDSPLAPLQLIESEGEGHYRSLRLMRPFLPPVALHFALARYFEDRPGQAALPIRTLLYGDGEWAAAGPVFRLSEEGLMAALRQVMERHPRCYDLRDTAGTHQVYRDQALPTPLDVLRTHYREGGA